MAPDRLVVPPAPRTPGPQGEPPATNPGEVDDERRDVPCAEPRRAAAQQRADTRGPGTTPDVAPLDKWALPRAAALPAASPPLAPTVGRQAEPADAAGTRDAVVVGGGSEQGADDADVPSLGHAEGGADDVALLARLALDDPRRPAVRERVVSAHLPLVEGLARRYTGRGEPYDDLVQVGTIGLLKAVDRYDHDRGVPLGAFAVPNILGEIRRHFRDRGWAVRVPRRLQETIRLLGDSRATLTQDLGRAPTVAELAQHARVAPDLVVEALESASAYSTVPLDADPELGGHQLGVEDAELAGVEDREALRPLLAALPTRERRILALRFVRGMSQSQIAAEVGISQMHVSRLLARTLAQLRQGLAD